MSALNSLVIQISTTKNLTANTIIPTIIKSESDFEIQFNKAAFENNSQSQQIISTYLGFTDVNTFWQIRNSLNNNIAKLNEKYELKTLSESQWANLIRSNHSILSKQSNIKFAMDDPNTNCMEMFNACVDNAKGQYAVECLACIGFGAIGWTGVGAGAFVICEGVTYYHLTTMKNVCNVSYTACVQQNGGKSD